MKKYSKFLKFLVVGCSNTAISLIIYYLLKSIGINYLVSIVAGYIISSITGFFLNKIWVFKVGNDNKYKNIFRYYILYGMALLLNIFLMKFQVELLGFSDNIAPLFTIVVTTLFNYFFSKNWVFNDSFRIDIKSIKKSIIENKMLSILTVVFFILVVFMGINNIYNHPAADDYSNYNNLVSYADDGSIDSTFEFVRVANRMSINIYKTWQGTYFSNYIFPLSPLLVSLNFYKFSLLLVQLFWIVSTFIFFKALGGEKNKKSFYTMYLLFMIFSLMFMYSLGEGIFWFTGVALYIIPFSMSLLMLSTIIKYFRTNKKMWLVIAALLSVMLGGTSYVTGLFIGFVLFMIVVYSFWKKRKDKYYWLALLLIFGAAFACNVLCPGNFNRVTSEIEMPIISVVKITLLNAMEMINDLLFKTLYVPFMLLLIPSIKGIISNTKIKFEKPLVLLLLCGICFVCLFFPCAYSYKSYYQETRVKNIQLFYLVIMLSVCVINYIGYYLQNKKIKEDVIKDNHIILIGVIALFAMVSSIGIKNINGVGMVDDILYDRSEKFDKCIDEMNKELLSDAKVARIKTCEVYPSSLHYHVVTNDGWITEAIEKYYDKEIEVVKDEG